MLCRLTETDLVVAEENMPTDPLGQDMYDDLAGSVTGTDAKSKKIFGAAGDDIRCSQFTDAEKVFKVIISPTGQVL